MPAPQWKQFVEDLIARNHQSPYLDRLRERLSPIETVAGIEAEIASEMASALGRTEDKLNAALLELELAAGEADRVEQGVARGAQTAAQLDAAYAAFNAVRARAERARLDLMIQREAIGIRRNAVLEEIYPIPPVRRRR